MLKPYNLTFMDEATPEIRAAVLAHAEPDFTVRFVGKSDVAGQRAAMPHTDIIMVLGAAVTRDLMSAAPNLKLIHRWGVGVDTIDLDAARRYGIGVAVTTAVNAGPVAELTVGLMLAVYRHIPLIDRQTRAGAWRGQQLRAVSRTLAGKRIGLIGFGNIGRAVARCLSGFEADVTFYSRRTVDGTVVETHGARQVSLDDLLRLSDVVSLHVPLTEGTSGLIDAAAISRMKKDAILVNTARGGLIDESALHAALVAGEIAGAGLDVWTMEPTAATNPLFSLDRVVATSHIGGSVVETIDIMAKRMFTNARALLQGRGLAANDLIVAPGRKDPEAR